MPAVRRSPRLALLAALPLVLAGVSACQEDKPTEPATVPTAPSTPLESIETTGLAVARADFCERVAPAQAQEALGAEVASSTSYANGEPARLGPGVKDVAHEFGCAWKAADGAVARAWVFAPPVTRARAHDLRDAALRRGCAAAKGSRFGAPSVTTLCTSDEGNEEGYFGLFGDAWLSCTLTLPAGPTANDQPERTSRWCAAVLLAASAETSTG
jgi:hypothetical protein